MKRPCSNCGRPVVARTHRGHTVTSDDHDLCRACWRAARDAARAEIEPPTEEVAPQPSTPVEGFAEALTTAMFGFPRDADEDEGEAA